MTEEYMQELERRIDNMMQRYELYRIHQDRVLLECMVKDYEAKQAIMLKQNSKM
jgi:hypothetical protein